MSENELIQVDPNLPAFAQEDAGAGTELLSDYIRPPRIKIIQANAGEDYADFWAGDMVAVPHMEVLADVIKDEASNKPTHFSETVYFTPIFFWPEWIVMNPYALKESLPMIRERTTDPKHPLVEMCRDPDQRFFECPENPSHKCKRMEVLNFLIVIELPGDHPLFCTPIVQSFRSGDWGTGADFCNKIRMRRGAPIYANRFEMRTKFNPNTQGDWRGFEIRNPSDEEPYVQDQTLYAMFKDIHEKMVEKHKDDLIQVDYEDSDVLEGEVITDM